MAELSAASEGAETLAVTGTSKMAELPAASEGAETLAVTDVTSTTEIAATSLSAENRMVTDVTALQDESSLFEKTPSPDIAESVNNKVESQPVTDVTPVTATVTPTFEPSAKPCNNSKACNSPILHDPPQNPKLYRAC